MDFAPASPDRSTPLRRLCALAWRYGTSTIGPVSVSASHLLASIIFLHALPPTDFGAFSFLLVIVPFCMSIVGAMVGAPVANALNGSGRLNPEKLAAYRKIALLLSAAAFLLVSILMRYSEGHWEIAVILGFYGAAMTLRWCARGFAFAEDRALNATLADLLYSMILVSSLLLLSFTDELFPATAASVLAVSATVSLLAYGRTYMREQLSSWKNGNLSLYPETWRDLSRWSLMGVVLTEATSNAHAYFVTFISGTAAFALLALGGLMMRPLSLVLSALTDRERPALARFIATGDLKGAKRTVLEFSAAGAAMWIFTILLAAAILLWFPELLLEEGYDTTHLLPVVAIWSLIWIARTLWTPQTALLQAAGEYSELARASMWSSIAALSATLLLLMIGGPVLSLFGVLIGDIVIGACIFLQAQAWRRRHV